MKLSKLKPYPLDVLYRELESARSDCSRLKLELNKLNSKAATSTSKKTYNDSKSKVNLIIEERKLLKWRIEELEKAIKVLEDGLYSSMKDEEVKLE